MHKSKVFVDMASPAWNCNQIPLLCIKLIQKTWERPGMRKLSVLALLRISPQASVVSWPAAVQWQGGTEVHHSVISAGEMSSTLNLEPPVPPVPRRSRSRSKEVRPVSGISQISNKSGVEIIQRCRFPVSSNHLINTLLFSEIIKTFVLWIR